MNDYREVDRALRVATEYKHHHWLSAHHMSAPQISVVYLGEAHPETPRELIIEIGVTNPNIALPPKFAVGIHAALEKAGIEHIPVYYFHEAPIVAHYEPLPEAA